MFVCCYFTSWQHLRYYQDGYQLVTVSTQGHFIVLLHWEITISTMTWYPTRSHYPDNEPTSPCPILIMLSAWLQSDKFQFSSHWFDSTTVRTHEARISRSAKTRTEVLLALEAALAKVILLYESKTEIIKRLGRVVELVKQCHIKHVLKTLYP